MTDVYLPVIKNPSLLYHLLCELKALFERQKPKQSDYNNMMVNSEK